VSIKLGVLLIGQTPNDFYQAFFRTCLPDSIRIEMAGVLDGLSVDEVLSLESEAENEVLFTRVGKNIPVVLPVHQVHSRMQGKVEELNARGVTAVIIACTRDFSFLNSSTPLIFPGRLLRNNVFAIARETIPIGVILPLEKQIETNLRKFWCREGIRACFAAASPGDHPGEVVKAAKRLKEKGAKLIVLDCMAYSSEEKAFVRQETDCMVILARTLLGSILKNLFE